MEKHLIQQQIERNSTGLFYGPFSQELIRCLCEGDSIYLEPYLRNHDPWEDDPQAFKSLQDLRLHREDCYLYLRSLAQWISYGFLISFLKDTELPIENTYPRGETWVSWDNSSQELVECQLPDGEFYDSTRYMYINSQAAILGQKSQLTLEHGHKPLLVLKREMDQVTAGETVAFRVPEFIHQRHLKEYCLAFLSSDKQIRFMPLEDFWPRDGKIERDDTPSVFTRSCTYEYDPIYSGLKRRDNVTARKVSAFKLLGQIRPTQVGIFKKRHEGTIFDTVFEAIELDFFGLWDQSCPSSLIRHLCEQHSHPESIYLTAGLHPLEDYALRRLPNYEHLVTRLDDFRKAVDTVKRIGFHVDYDAEPVVSRPGRHFITGEDDLPF